MFHDFGSVSTYNIANPNQIQFTAEVVSLTLLVYDDSNHKENAALLIRWLSIQLRVDGGVYVIQHVCVHTGVLCVCSHV